jgi:Spy/CpxP family protein refolding chaperone
MSVRGRITPWFVAFLVLVFATGVGTGLLVARYVPSVVMRRPFPRPSPAEITRRLAVDLSLTADQQRQVENIFARSSEQLERLHESTGQQFDALRAQMDGDIEKILTPEQRQRFRAMLPPRRSPGDGPPMP